MCLKSRGRGVVLEKRERLEIYCGFYLKIKTRIISTLIH
jgi:hypothetical protein